MDLDKAFTPIFGKLPDIIDPRIRMLIESSGMSYNTPMYFQSPINLSFLERKITRVAAQETVETEFTIDYPDLPREKVLQTERPRRRKTRLRKSLEMARKGKMQRNVESPLEIMGKPSPQNYQPCWQPPKIKIVIPAEPAHHSQPAIPRTMLVKEPPLLRLHHPKKTQSRLSRNPSDNIRKRSDLSYDQGPRVGKSARARRFSDTFEYSESHAAAISALFTEIINASNGVEIELQKRQSYYKYYVGKGNNGHLIKRLFDKRAGWMSTNDINEANAVWTQNRKKSFIKSLPRFKGEHTLDEKYATNYTQYRRTYKIPIKVLQQELRLQGITDITLSPLYKTLLASKIQSNNVRIWNKLQYNYNLANKKALYRNMKEYYESRQGYVFSVLPMTWHVINGTDDQEWNDFHRYAEHYKEKLWIVKPGENTNRGHGIAVYSSINNIRNKILKSRNSAKTYIIQEYIKNPLLISSRKFDIRWYALFTAINGNLQGYYYKDGYIRTASQNFNLKKLNDKMVHLTNDAIQKKSDDYGKYENCNKLSYEEFQDYISMTYPAVNFFKEILPQIRKIIQDTLQAVWDKIDSKKRQHTFELFGYDFMIDANFHVWLIEVNTNPWLETSAVYLAKIVPAMMDNAFRIAVDPLFPSKKTAKENERSKENRFELIFSSVN